MGTVLCIVLGLMLLGITLSSARAIYPVWAYMSNGKTIEKIKNKKLRELYIFLICFWEDIIALIFIITIGIFAK